MRSERAVGIVDMHADFPNRAGLRQRDHGADTQLAQHRRADQPEARLPGQGRQLVQHLEQERGEGGAFEHGLLGQRGDDLRHEVAVGTTRCVGLDLAAQVNRAGPEHGAQFSQRQRMGPGAVIDGGRAHFGCGQRGNGAGAIGSAIKRCVVMHDDGAVAGGMHVELDLFERHGGGCCKALRGAVPIFEGTAAMGRDACHGERPCLMDHLTAPMVMPRTRCRSTSTKRSRTGRMVRVEAAITRGQSIRPSPGLML